METLAPRLRRGAQTSQGGPTAAHGYTSPLPEDVPLQAWIRHHFADEGMAAADALEPITSDMLKHAAKM